MINRTSTTGTADGSARIVRSGPDYRDDVMIDEHARLEQLVHDLADHVSATTCGPELVHLFASHRCLVAPTQNEIVEAVDIVTWLSTRSDQRQRISVSAELADVVIGHIETTESTSAQRLHG